jgi:hypothetical protein
MKRVTYTLDDESIARSERLENELDLDKSKVVRLALKKLELQQSNLRQDVMHAVLALAAALEPDERYDPADDPRREEATQRLAALLGSTPAAEGIAQALVVLGAGTG